MAKRDYYETLGLSRSADDQELKSAFRKLAKQYHPDRNPDDDDAEIRFKEINEAYEVLKDKDKRAAYDRFGHAAFDGSGFGGALKSWYRVRLICSSSDSTCAKSVLTDTSKVRLEVRLYLTSSPAL